MPYTQTVIFEPKNSGPLVYRIISYKPITLDLVVEYFTRVHDFDQDRDSVTFVDEVTDINLEEQ